MVKDCLLSIESNAFKYNYVNNSVFFGEKDIERQIMRLVFIILSVCAVAESGHVVLIAPPFYGHMIPLLDFAKRLSEDHYVTYIVSASKLDTLKRYASVDENTHSQLRFIGLVDGNDHDYEVSYIISIIQTTRTI